jgi:hypothetical protein
MAESLVEQGGAKTRRARASAKTDVPKKGRVDGRIAATLVLSESVDFRLTTIAKSLKVDRSTLAVYLLDAGLRRYALDAALRQHLGGADVAPELGGAGE